MRSLVLLSVLWAAPAPAAEPTDGGAAISDGGAAISDGGAAIADGGAASADGGAAITDGGKSIAAAVAPKRALDFDLFGDEKKSGAPDAIGEANQRAFARKVQLRRSLLKWHQGMGFATLALLTATLVLGQLDYLDRFDGNYTNRYDLAHLVVAGATTAQFAVTATLALAAPNPYPKKIKFDAAFVHKGFMALAAICFITQAILGPISVQKGGTLNERPLALTHLVVGYASYAFMWSGTIAYMVK